MGAAQAEEFRVATPEGWLTGWDAGQGTPVLILHGGPCSDYTDDLPDLLPGGLRTIRYQQRGLAPSSTDGPFEIEAHVADAVRVLDGRGVERAILLGHSWGGHLAFHVAVAHPDRLLAVVALDPLGAVPDGGWSALDENILAVLEADSPADADRARELDARITAGDGTAADGEELMRLAWRGYFADPPNAPPPLPLRHNTELFAAVVTSVYAHFERETLVRGLPALSVPFAVVHGERDPVPWQAGQASAELVPGSRFVLLPGCGHFPWLERPDALRAVLAELLG